MAQHASALSTLRQEHESQVQALQESLAAVRTQQSETEASYRDQMTSLQEEHSRAKIQWEQDIASKLREAHEASEAMAREHEGRTNQVYRDHEAIMQQALSKIKTLEGTIESIESEKANLRDNVQALERKVAE